MYVRRWGPVHPCRGLVSQPVVELGLHRVVVVQPRVRLHDRCFVLTQHLVSADHHGPLRVLQILLQLQHGVDPQELPAAPLQPQHSYARPLLLRLGYESMLALRLLAAVGVQQVVPAGAVQRRALPAQMPLATAGIRCRLEHVGIDGTCSLNVVWLPPPNMSN